MLDKNLNTRITAEELLVHPHLNISTEPMPLHKVIRVNFNVSKFKEKMTMNLTKKIQTKGMVTVQLLSKPKE